MSTPDSVAPTPTVERTLILFLGTGAEFFRIWIVNLALTVLTFGFYTPWARVRTRRYLYGSTLLQEHSFAYLADPRRLLRGFLIVIAFFLAYSVLGSISPVAGVVLLGLMFFAVPWLLKMALRFRARNSAYRGVRFGFDATYGEMFKLYGLWPILSVLSLGILVPYFDSRRRGFLVSRHRFGSVPFAFHGTARAVYRIFGLTSLLFLPGVLLYLGVVGLVLAGGLDDPEALANPLVSLAPLLFLLTTIFLCLPYFRSRIFNYTWNNTSIAENRFHAHLRCRDLAWIYASNLVGILLTAGLFTPWAIIRTHRLKLHSLSVDIRTDWEAFLNQPSEEVSATGQMAQEFFDLDMGL